MILAVEALADDLGGVGVPVALAVVPVFAHLLQADQVDVQLVDGAGDLGKLVVLVGFLVGVQVEGEHLEVGVAGAVVAAAIVVPAFAGGAWCSRRRTRRGRHHGCAGGRSRSARRTGLGCGRRSAGSCPSGRGRRSRGCAAWCASRRRSTRQRPPAAPGSALTATSTVSVFWST